VGFLEEIKGVSSKAGIYPKRKGSQHPLFGKTLIFGDRKLRIKL